MSLGIAELFQQMWKLHASENFVDKASDPLYFNLVNVMVVMWNMTDKCTALCEYSLGIGVHKDALKYMNAINPQDTNNIRYADLHAHTQTHARLSAVFPWLHGWANNTTKVKPIWILLKQETLSGSGISWASLHLATDR